MIGSRSSWGGPAPSSAAPARPSASKNSASSPSRPLAVIRPGLGLSCAPSPSASAACSEMRATLSALEGDLSCQPEGDPVISACDPIRLCASVLERHTLRDHEMHTSQCWSPPPLLPLPLSQSVIGSAPCGRGKVTHVQPAAHICEFCTQTRTHARMMAMQPCNAPQEIGVQPFNAPHGSARTRWQHSRGIAIWRCSRAMLHRGNNVARDSVMSQGEVVHEGPADPLLQGILWCNKGYTCCKRIW